MIIIPTILETIVGCIVRSIASRNKNSSVPNAQHIQIITDILATHPLPLDDRQINIANVSNKTQSFKEIHCFYKWQLVTVKRIQPRNTSWVGNNLKKKKRKKKTWVKEGASKSSSSTSAKIA